MANSVANVIINTLADLGVKRIYGLPGDSINPLVDSIRTQYKIEFVQVRHEEGASLEATFEAKFTGELTVCMGTSGPGSIHLINGLYEAKMSRIPVLALTGQIETDLLYRDYFQEVDLDRLFDDVSVFNAQIVNPDSASYVLQRAYRESISKHGVSHLTVPVDILRMNADYQPVQLSRIETPHFVVDPSPAEKLLNESKHPLLFVGRGAIGQTEEIIKFAEKIGSPILYSVNAKGLLDDDDPKVMGPLGLLGTRTSVEAMKRADLIILLGTIFPYVSFINEKAKVLQVDVDSTNIGKRVHVDVAYQCTVADFLAKVKPDEKKEKFYAEILKEKEDWISSMMKLESDMAKPIKPEFLAKIISKKANRDAVFIVDTGNVTVWATRHIKGWPDRTFLLSPWLGTMGVGIPGAVGVSFATDRQVIAITGDGSAAMTMMELITAKKYNRPVKIVIFNNSKLGMIKFEEEVMGYPEWGVDLLNPDFSKIAEAIGINGIRVEEPDKVEPAVQEFLKVEGPAVLDAVVDGDERPMPPKLTFAQIKGYVTSILREKIE
ncbi:thiamine pyrophosphate-dependent enzyme [Thermoplasma sp.]|uniref:thiamine pyrophosphate-dependent enzyme n=1 Tax=Thermoplasma sp. TaxID=1973142 RepID=UPI00127077C7|nr:thiamine pyrophosphate-dependent enzyme [Thermoplasma sp.]KAA8923539.1 MAG: pyruvate oxidase [Thermoplasma sp.]